MPIDVAGAAPYAAVAMETSTAGPWYPLAMAIEVEPAGLSGFAYTPADPEPAGDLAMSDEAFVSVVAGAFLVAAALAVGTGFGAGYLVKRGLFCPAPRRI